MKATPKADQCINMINEISVISYTLQHLNGDKYTNEYIDRFKSNDKLELLLSSDRDTLNNLKRKINQLYFICYYRLIPLVSIKHNGNSSFIGKGDDVKDDTKSFLISKESIKPDEFEDFWYIVTTYDEVTIDDLKAEFWEISDSIETFDTSYQIMKLKYKDVYSRIPDQSYYDYFKLIEEAKIRRYIDYVVEYKIATEKEIEHLIFRICKVVEGLNMTLKSIVDMYKSFIPDNATEPTTPLYSEIGTSNLPSELDSPETYEILNRAIENGLVELENCKYKWIGSKELLAYFCQQVSFKLDLRKGKRDGNNNKTVSWKPFEVLFGVKRISSGKDSWTKTHTTFHPVNYESVDKIIT